MREAACLRRERAQGVVAEPGDEAPAQRLEQPVGVEHPGARHERGAGLVVAPDDRGPLVGVVHGALHEQLERRVLLLDDEHLGEAVGEVADLLLVDRHRHQEVEQADAGTAQVVVAGETEQAERLAQLVVGVPAGGDADPVPLGRHRHAVEPVGHAVAAGRAPSAPAGTRAPSPTCTA